MKKLLALGIVLALLLLGLRALNGAVQNVGKLHASETDRASLAAIGQ